MITPPFLALFSKGKPRTPHAFRVVGERFIPDERPYYWDVIVGDDTVEVTAHALDLGIYEQGWAWAIAPGTGRILGVVYTAANPDGYPCWWDDGVLTVAVGVDSNITAISDDGTRIALTRTIYNTVTGDSVDVGFEHIRALSPDGLSVCGFSTVGGVSQSRKWVNGVETILDLPAGFGYSDTDGITDGGVYVAGTVTTNTGFPATQNVVRWGPSGIDTILSGDYYPSARDITPDGDVINIYGTDPQISRWRSGTITADPTSGFTTDLRQMTPDGYAMVGTGVVSSIGVHPMYGLLWAGNAVHQISDGATLPGYGVRLYDIMEIDLPFLPWGAGVTFNPDDKSTMAGLTNGNLTLAALDGPAVGQYRQARSTISHDSGRWKVKFRYDGNLQDPLNAFGYVGVCIGSMDLDTTNPENIFGGGVNIGLEFDDTGFFFYATDPSGDTGLPWNTGDFPEVWVDFDAGKVWLGVNGVFAGDPIAGTGESYTFTPGTALFAVAGSLDTTNIITAIFDY